jgi:hypothetical protein
MASQAGSDGEMIEMLQIAKGELPEAVKVLRDTLDGANSLEKRPREGIGETYDTPRQAIL